MGLIFRNIKRCEDCSFFDSISPPEHRCECNVTGDAIEWGIPDTCPIRKYLEV